MSETAECTGSAEDDADANEVLLEELKRQKRVPVMQLTKLYIDLMRLMSEETIDPPSKTWSRKKNGCCTKFWKT